MPIFEFTPKAICALPETTFSFVNLHERRDIQRLLRENIGVIAPDTLVISEEFAEWDGSRRRIDLLGIDKDANLVVIELKRTEDGGEMDLQAIRYASMISTMTFDRAVEVFEAYLLKNGKEDPDPRGTIIAFLGKDVQPEEHFGQDVRIILASAEFSRELTSSVLWLIDHSIDIKCVRLKPYVLDGRVLVDVQQIIPLPELEGVIIKMRDKTIKERQARKGGTDTTKYDISFDGTTSTKMSKRTALLQICSFLCTRGISPEDLSNVIDQGPNRVWYVVDGLVDPDTFKTSAAETAKAKGKSFDSMRWFCSANELVQLGGKTYAFSSQWGGDNWLRAIEAIKDAYPEFKITYDPVD